MVLVRRCHCRYHGVVHQGGEELQAWRQHEGTCVSEVQE